MKTLSGKQWFYSMGQRSITPHYIGVTPRNWWPIWAVNAFKLGRLNQTRKKYRGQ